MSTTFMPTGRGLSFGGLLRSEWIKLRSIRSTWWCFAILIVLTVALGALLSATLSTPPSGAASSAAATQGLAVQSVTIGIAFSSLVICVLGVLIISGEYGTGMIRSTLTAVPTRVPALIAKALVFAIVTFVVGLLSFAIVVPISVALLSGKGIDVDLGDPAYWLALVGGAGYLVLVGLIAFSIGAIVRNTAGAVALALGLLLVAPIVIGLIGSLTQVTWMMNVVRVLPSELGSPLYSYPAESTAPASDLWTFEPWQSAALLLAWVAVLFAAAVVLLKRRDA